MRSLARRIEHLDAEIADHDRAIKALIDTAAPQLVAEFGIGYVTAATFYLAWSQPGRCRSEAAFARLAGVAPIEATSGQNQQRHRLCRVTIHVPQAVVRVGSQGLSLKSRVSASMAGMSCLRVVER